MHNRKEVEERVLESICRGNYTLAAICEDVSITGKIVGKIIHKYDLFPVMKEERERERKEVVFWAVLNENPGIIRGLSLFSSVRLSAEEIYGRARALYGGETEAEIARQYKVSREAMSGFKERLIKENIENRRQLVERLCRDIFYSLVNNYARIFLKRAGKDEDFLRSLGYFCSSQTHLSLYELYRRVKMVSSGKSVIEISKELGISPSDLYAFMGHFGIKGIYKEKMREKRKKRRKRKRRETF